ncbi:hypothetical protein [Streptomyces sp. NBC_01198]|uniref:hypothetical protein n=1 Tax=Streptomyces sp. NBC_01198 TaxID=2903769 RepID=UPI002E161CDD|nr:hypothetical protein OG702_34780 [Streptomyces sp. NBC_01198]
MGSALTSVVWVHSGWTGVCVLGAAFSSGTVAIWVVERVTANRSAGKPPKTSVHQGHDPTPAASTN